MSAAESSATSSSAEEDSECASVQTDMDFEPKNEMRQVSDSPDIRIASEEHAKGLLPFDLKDVEEYLMKKRPVDAHAKVLIGFMKTKGASPAEVNKKLDHLGYESVQRIQMKKYMEDLRVHFSIATKNPEKRRVLGAGRKKVIDGEVAAKALGELGKDIETKIVSKSCVAKILEQKDIRLRRG